MSSKGILRSISVPSGKISKGTKKRRRSEPGRIKKTSSSSKSDPKIPTPPPLPQVKDLTYRPKRKTPPPKNALNLGIHMIYNPKTNPIGFTFLSSGALNGSDYLYDIEYNKEYNRNSRELKKLTSRQVLMIELNNQEIKNAYIKEHGIILKKGGGSKTRRNKNPHKKTKRRVRFTIKCKK
jgi:hypothetical protein